MGKLREEWDNRVRPSIPEIGKAKRELPEIIIGDRVYARVSVNYGNGCFLRGQAIMFVVEIDFQEFPNKMYALNPVFISSDDPASKVLKAATSYMNIWVSEKDILGKVKGSSVKSPDNGVVCVAKMSRKISEE